MSIPGAAGSRRAIDTTRRRFEKRMKRSLASAASSDCVLQRHAALAVGQLLQGCAASLVARGAPLVLGSEQGDLANVVQVQTNGVVHCVSSDCIIRPVTQLATRPPSPVNDMTMTETMTDADSLSQTNTG